MKTASRSLTCDGPLLSIKTIGTDRLPCVGLVLVKLQMQFRSKGRPSHVSVFQIPNQPLTGNRINMKTSLKLITAFTFATLVTHPSAVNRHSSQIKQRAIAVARM